MKRNFLLCLWSTMMLFAVSCDSDDDSKLTPHPTPIETIKFIGASQESSVNNIPLFFKVTPEDATVEIEELLGAYNGTSSTSDEDYMAFGQLSELRIDKLENKGNGSYTLYTKFYVGDKLIVKKSTQTYNYFRPNISIKLKGGKVSNEISVRFKSIPLQ